MRKIFRHTRLTLLFILLVSSCKIKNRTTPEDIQAMKLKEGELVLCGPSGKKFGTIAFENSCSDKVKDDFNLAVALLHSFEYDEAEKVFARIIAKEPGCAMAYWGVAMSNFHPLWAPAGPVEFEKGARAIQIARTINNKSERESAYIEAVAHYYTDRDKVNEHDRCILFEKAMEEVYRKYPEDKEAAIFYALSLDAAANPADKSYTNQRKAGEILQAIYPGQPEHPGVVHYIIHSYDYPELAREALPAARKYASIAPSSAHAQHMPSHIFTRLGLWDECISSNLVSTSSAKCYAENASIKGHWDEELHGLDYLEYAYLQKGDNRRAKELVDYLDTIQQVYPVNFKVAYAFAAIPSRYVLENKLWKDATNLQIHPRDFPWTKFPWQRAIVYFTRALGYAHMGDLIAARTQLGELKRIHDTLMSQKDMYKANQVAIQVKSTDAWIFFAQGEKAKALERMRDAANDEDATEKSPVTPGEVIPARELLGDMLLQSGNFTGALNAYEADLKTHPNRFNGLHGAALSAEKSGDRAKAAAYYRQLLAISEANSPRDEYNRAEKYLKTSTLNN